MPFARRLQNKGLSVLLLEKSRGLGGRVATRRIEDQGFDHGVTHLASHELIKNLLKDLSLPSIETPEGTFVPGGMGQLARDLAILKEKKVEFLKKTKSSWVVTTDTGEVFEAKNVLITAPFPQPAELLVKNNLEYCMKKQCLDSLF